MMTYKNGNSLIVIENGMLSTYVLDNRLVWDVGRPSKDNAPDIKLHSLTVSRKHGRFQNIDGIWFYVDRMGINGTVYNRKHLQPGIRGHVKPVILNAGDILIFGGPENATIDSKTVWTLFLNKVIDDSWKVEDTKGMVEIAFSCNGDTTVFEKPEKGTVIEKENGIAIYMGDETYIVGDMSIRGLRFA